MTAGSSPEEAIIWVLTDIHETLNKTDDPLIRCGRNKLHLFPLLQQSFLCTVSSFFFFSSFELELSNGQICVALEVNGNRRVQSLSGEDVLSLTENRSRRTLEDKDLKFRQMSTITNLLTEVQSTTAAMPTNATFSACFCLHWPDSEDWNKI